MDASEYFIRINTLPTHIDLYLLRDNIFENLSLFRFYQMHYIRNGSVVARRSGTKQPVIVPVPFSPPQSEQYYCQQFILHHPFKVLPTPVGK